VVEAHQWLQAIGTQRHPLWTPPSNTLGPKVQALVAVPDASGEVEPGHPLDNDSHAFPTASRRDVGPSGPRVRAQAMDGLATTPQSNRGSARSRRTDTGRREFNHEPEVSYVRNLPDTFGVLLLRDTIRASVTRASVRLCRGLGLCRIRRWGGWDAGMGTRSGLDARCT